MVFSYSVLEPWFRFLSETAKADLGSPENLHEMSARRKRKAKRQAKRADSFSDKMAKIKRLTSSFPREYFLRYYQLKTRFRTYANHSRGESWHRTDTRSSRKSRIAAIEPHFWFNSATADDWADRWHRYSTRIEKYINSQNCAFISIKSVLCSSFLIFGEYQALLLQKIYFYHSTYFYYDI